MRALTTAVVAAAFALAALVGACDAAGPSGEARSEGALVASAHVLTQHNDIARTGLNPAESILTPDVVSSGRFGKLFARDVDGQVYAQPLYVSGIDGRGVVYVATQHNSVYAFDATGASLSPLWTRQLGPSVPSTDTRCGDIQPEVGITSTPVIDLERRTLFVSAKTKEGARYVHRLHALDIATGDERSGSPVEIRASVPGSGAGSVGGRIAFDPLIELNRPGLLLLNGVVYLAFASHCDVGTYHGWVLAYDATTLELRGAHVTTPDGEQGGIWHGGVGLAGGARDVYYVSGNGTYDGARNFGEAVVRLVPSPSGALTVETSFAPFDAKDLDRDDVDIGSTGALLVPESNVLVTADKGGRFYVVARDRMGGQAAGDRQIVQRFQGTAHAAFGGLAFFDRTLFTWGAGDVLKAYHWNGGTFDTTPHTNELARAGSRGAQLSVSSNGVRDGIVWTVRPGRGGIADGVVEAFDAANVSRRLWSSETDDRDRLGALAKFASPTIASGNVFLGTAGKQLVAYGLREHGPAADGGGAITDAAGAGDGSLRATTFAEIFRDWLGPGTPGHCTSCHTRPLGGFTCGSSKDECYAGLLAAGLIAPNAPSSSLLVEDGASPLSWFGGDMPQDAPTTNEAARAALRGWIAAGARND